MEKETKEREQERGPKDVARPSAFRSLGAHGRRNTFLPRPGNLDSASLRTLRRTHSHDPARSIAMSKAISSSYSSTHGLLHLPQRRWSQSTPYSGHTQRSHEKKEKSGGPVAPSQTETQKIEVTQVLDAASKAQATEGKSHVTSRHDPSRHLRHRAQLLSPKQLGVLTPPSPLKPGLKVTMRGIHRAKKGVIQRLNEFLKGNGRAAQVPPHSVEMPSMSTSSATGQPPLTAPDSAMSTQPPSNAAQAVGPSSTTMERATVSTKPDAGARIEDSADSAKLKKISGGKAPTKSRQKGKSYKGKGDKRVVMGVSTLAANPDVVTLVTKSGRSIDDTMFSDGTKDGVALTSSTAETVMEIDPVPATSSLQALKGNPQHTHVSENKKAPSAASKQTSDTSGRKRVKARRSEGAQSKKNRVSLESTRVANPSQLQVSVGSSTSAGFQGSSATAHMGGSPVSSQDTSHTTQATSTTGTATSTSGAAASLPSAGKSDMAATASTSGSSPNTGEASQYPPGTPGWLIYMYEVYSLMPDPFRLAMDTTASSVSTTQGHDGNTPFTGSQPGSQDPSTSQVSKDTGPSGSGLILPGGEAEVQHRGPISDTASSTTHLTIAPNAGPSSIVHPETESSLDKAHKERLGASKQHIPDTAQAAGPPGTATTSTGAAASPPSAGKSDVGATASTSGSSPNTGEASQYPPGTPGWLIYMYEVYSLMPDPSRLAMDTTASSVSTTQGHDGNTPFTGSQPGSQDPSTSQVSKDTGPSGSGLILPGGQAEVQHRGPISDTATNTAHLTITPNVGASSTAPQDTQSSSGKTHKGRRHVSRTLTPAAAQATDPTATASTSAGKTATTTLPSAGKSDRGATTSTSDSHSKMGETSTDQEDTLGLDILFGEADAGSVPESEGSAVPPKSSHDTKERQEKKGPVRGSGGIAGKKRKATTSEGTPSGGNRVSRARAGWGDRLEGAPRDRILFTDTKSGDLPLTTVASDGRKSRMASSSSTAEVQEGTASQSTATSLQTLEGSHVNIQVSVVKSTGKKTLGTPRERKIRVNRSKGKASKQSQFSTACTIDPTSSQFLISVGSATPTGKQGSSETTPLGVSTDPSAALAAGSPAIPSGSAPASTKPVSTAIVAIANTDLQKARRSHQHLRVSKAPRPSGIDKHSSEGIAGKKRKVPNSKGTPCEGKRVILAATEDTRWPGTPDARSPVTDSKSGGTLITESSDVITTGARTVTAIIYLPPVRDWNQGPDMSMPSTAATTGKQLSRAPGLSESRAPRSRAAASKKRRASSASTGLPSSREVRFPVGKVISAGTRGSPTKISSQSTSSAAQSVVATDTVTTSEGTTVTCHPTAGISGACDVDSLITMLQTVSLVPCTTERTVIQGHSATALPPSGTDAKIVPMPPTSDSHPAERSQITTTLSAAAPSPGALGARPYLNDRLSRRKASSTLTRAGTGLKHESVSLTDILQKWRQGHRILRGTVTPGHSATVLSTSGTDAKTVPMPPPSDSDPEERSKVTTDSSAVTPSPGALEARPYLNDRLSRRKASSTLTRVGTGLKHESVSLTDILQKWRQGHRILRGTVTPGHSTTVLSPSGTDAKMASMPPPSDSDPEERSKVTTDSSAVTPSPGALGARPYLNDRLSRRKAPSTLTRAGTGLKHESVSLTNILQKWRQGHRILRGTVSPGHSATVLSPSGTDAKMASMPPPSDSDPEERSKVTTDSSTVTPSPGALGARPYLNDRLSRRKASSTLTRAGTGLKHESVSLIDILQKWRQGHRILRGTVTPGHSATALSSSDQ